MYYTKDIGQDIAVPPMIIPGIYDPAPEPKTHEGTGTTGVLTREGVTTELDSTLVPENVEETTTMPDEEETTRTSSS
jgi:hypothetical protein